MTCTSGAGSSLTKAFDIWAGDDWILSLEVPNDKS